MKWSMFKVALIRISFKFGFLLTQSRSEISRKSQNLSLSCTSSCNKEWWQSVWIQYQGHFYRAKLLISVKYLLIWTVIYAQVSSDNSYIRCTRSFSKRMGEGTNKHSRNLITVLLYASAFGLIFTMKIVKVAYIFL